MFKKVSFSLLGVCFFYPFIASAMSPTSQGRSPDWQRFYQDNKDILESFQGPRAGVWETADRSTGMDRLGFFSFFPSNGTEPMTARTNLLRELVEAGRGEIVEGPVYTRGEATQVPLDAMLFSSFQYGRS